MRNKWNVCETTINTHTDCLHIPAKIFMHTNLKLIQMNDKMIKQKHTQKDHIYIYGISSTYVMQTWSSGNVVLSHVYRPHTHTHTHSDTKGELLAKDWSWLKCPALTCPSLIKARAVIALVKWLCVCVCVCVCVYMLVGQLEPYESLPHPLCSSQRWINHVQRCQHLPKQFYMGINGRWGCCSLFNQFHQTRFYLV